MATVSLKATLREGTGKGAARKLRQSGSVPGVVYGHSREARSVTINTRELGRLLEQASGAAVVELSFDGTTARTLIREIQRHPFNRSIIHVDFQELIAGEKVTLSIPIRFSGIPEGVRTGGGILEEILHQVRIRVDPVSIPEHVAVDVTHLTLGHSIHVRDLGLAAEVEVLDDPSATVCVVSIPKAVEATATPGAETEGATSAEPELIRKPKGEDEAETEAKSK